MNVAARGFGNAVADEVLVGRVRVALRAGDFLVLAEQRERRRLVIERRRRLPRRLVVALLALAAELAAVLVEVAGVAALGRARGSVVALGLLFEQAADRRVDDQRALVAVVAAGLRVRALERPAGLLVIELIAPAFPVDHREVEPAVVGVAALAVVALRGRQAAVEARALGDRARRARCGSRGRASRTGPSAPGGTSRSSRDPRARCAAARAGRARRTARARRAAGAEQRRRSRRARAPTS